MRPRYALLLALVAPLVAAAAFINTNPAAAAVLTAHLIAR